MKLDFHGEGPSFRGFYSHYCLQLELLSTSDVIWLPYTIEFLAEGFVGGFLTRTEFFLSTRGIPLLTLGGWELYLGEKSFRCVLGEIRILVHSLLYRFWHEDAHISDIPLEIIDGFLLSDGPSTLEIFASWWRAQTIGAQTWSIHFLGDIIDGSVMMIDWMACVREPSHEN